MFSTRAWYGKLWKIRCKIFISIKAYIVGEVLIHTNKRQQLYDRRRMWRHDTRQPIRSFHFKLESTSLHLSFLVCRLWGIVYAFFFNVFGRKKFLEDPLSLINDICISNKTIHLKKIKKNYTTRKGFEPSRAEHIGLAVQHLNHSVTSSISFEKFILECTTKK